MFKDPSAQVPAFAPVRPGRPHAGPTRVLQRAPVWCSVDLRDGNQALIEPMDRHASCACSRRWCASASRRSRSAFPSASQTDFDFVRLLIDEKLMPDDVTIQVLTQAREPLIRRTFESLPARRACHRAPVQRRAPVMRRVVLGPGRGRRRRAGDRPCAAVRDLAAEAAGHAMDVPVLAGDVLRHRTGVQQARRRCGDRGVAADAASTSASSTCRRRWSTRTPNIFADMIEWMHRHLARRDAIVLSVHPHNDRGTGTAAGEFALMAGADRIEGCLFGNGERTGNVDLVNIALNLYTQGVAPGLDFSDIDEIRRSVEHCNQLPVHPRHPYVGDLVYTSFSGSHQDAIKKAFARAQGGRHLGHAVPAARPEGPRPQLRGGDPRQQPVGQGRHLVPARSRVRPANCRGGCRSSSARPCSAVMDVDGREISAGDLWALFEREYGIGDGARVDHHSIERRPAAAAGAGSSADVLVDGRNDASSPGEGNGRWTRSSHGLAALDRRARRKCSTTTSTPSARAHRRAPPPTSSCASARGRRCSAWASTPNIVSASMKAVLSGMQRAGQR